MTLSCLPQVQFQQTLLEKERAWSWGLGLELELAQDMAQVQEKALQQRDVSRLGGTCCRFIRGLDLDPHAPQQCGVQDTRPPFSGPGYRADTTAQHYAPFMLWPHLGLGAAAGGGAAARYRVRLVCTLPWGPAAASPRRCGRGGARAVP